MPNQRLENEPFYVTDLLRRIDVLDTSLRLFVVGNDATARPHLTAALVNRITASGRTVITSLTGLAPPSSPPHNCVVLINDAQILSPTELQILTNLLHCNDIGIVIASGRVTPALGPTHSDISTTGTVLHLSPANHSTIRNLAAERGVAIDDTTLTQLELLSAGSFGSLEAYFESAPANSSDMSEVLRTHFLHQVTALPPLERDIVKISLAISDVDVHELHFDQERDTLTVAFDRAVSTGLFASQSPIIADALAESTNAGRIRTELVKIVDLRIKAGTLDMDTATRLFDSGVRHKGLTNYFRENIDNSTAETAADLFRRVQSVEDLNVADTLRYAQVAARSGNLDNACRLADSVLTDALTNLQGTADCASLAGAVRIRAGASAACGQLRVAADLYSWLGPDRLGAESAFAAITFLGTGQLDEAIAALANGTGSPSSITVGATTLADGLIQSITGVAPIALNTMSRALALPGGTDSSVFQPDSAPALVALALLHNGAPERAASAISAAIAIDDANSHTWARHHILSAWIAMLSGHDNVLEKLPKEIVTGPLRERDALFLQALIVGVARRSGDLAQLRRAWSSAEHTLSACNVDLFALMPIGELWLAAVRLDECEPIEHLVDDARSLLRTLGEPPLWSSPFHWYGVQAAILSQSPADLLPHARTLTESAKTHTYAAGLANAGRQWLLLMQGMVDADEVESAARGLKRIGLPWDAARLAGEAALRAPDTKSATALLHVARSLRIESSIDRTDGFESSGTVAPPSVLTEREQEVAELVVLGLTYREIGERLYISAKTVEHHVARIKRKVDAQSRSDLMVILRTMITLHPTIS
ncbi:LuxR family transcriptional regulator [Rhodococcus sp. IEGM 1379]|uniref:helix-turn-helix transcriptional regulator n=1 Tax=Rhodococcus sp. IEGM 1379 TaxID=3047086 RepID=UPI0024B6B4BE|nr:LuxR family transcriptional regulator [Rhodococcus sp. IEGM 1379]MDI9915092.1 LuxR C-terminal-related transcriptional regulator [Rhodococcus sp. IEGM 1379]